MSKKVIFWSSFCILGFIGLFLFKVGLIDYYIYSVEEFLDSDVKYFEYDDFNLKVDKCDNSLENQFFDGIQNISWNNSNLIINSRFRLNCIEKVDGGSIEFVDDVLFINYNLKDRGDRYAMCTCGKKFKFEIFNVSRKNITIKFLDFESFIFEDGSTKSLMRNSKMKIISQKKIKNISNLNTEIINYSWIDEDKLQVFGIFKLRYCEDNLYDFDFYYDVKENSLMFRGFSKFFCPEEGDLDFGENVSCESCNEFEIVEFLVYDFDKRNISKINVKFMD